MISDAYITQVNFVKPHPNAERLDLAYIRKWQCVVPKDSIKRDETVLYIQPDAMLNEAARESWAAGLVRYLGKNGRVKIVRLRDMISNGIIVKLNDIKNELKDVDYNSISPTQLCSILGIEHYQAPVPADLSAKCSGLPLGIEKSDEENFQNLSEEELHLGEEVLVTKKMDGSSAVLYYNPSTDDLEMCSRSMTLKIKCHNNYTDALSPHVDKVKALAKHLGTTVAIRGEVCGNNVNANKANMDAKKPLGFYMYGVRLPELSNEEERMGRWGSKYHFTKINEILTNELHLGKIPTVPVLGTVVLSMDQLTAWEQAPASEGEGVVVNGKTFTYKAKSADYYAKLK